MAKPKTGKTQQGNGQQEPNPQREAIEQEGDAIDRSTLPPELSGEGDEGGEEQDTGQEEAGDEGESGEDSGEGERVPVDIGGRTVYLSPEDAAAVLQHLNSAPSGGKTGKQGQEQAPDPYAGLDQLIFTDPNQAIQRIRDNVKTELRQEYQVAENRKQFWNDFFSENQDLKRVPHLVDAVMTANLNTLRPLTVEGARKKLAELTRKEIAKVSKTGGTRSGPNLESGGRRTSPAPRQQAEDERPKTLTGLLRERAAKRRQAQLGKEQ